MKKLILLLLFIPLVSFGQDTIQATKILTQKEAYLNEMMELKKNYNAVDRYVIYPTTNMYTSLELDTQTGRIWQVQIGLGDSSTAMKTFLSDRYFRYDEDSRQSEYEEALKGWEADPDEDKEDWKPNLDWYELGVVGQYKLYPTDNMYNFIMVDTINGFTYQVQWSIDEDSRIVMPIF